MGKAKGEGQVQCGAFALGGESSNPAEGGWATPTWGDVPCIRCDSGRGDGVEEDQEEGGEGAEEEGEEKPCECRIYRFVVTLRTGKGLLTIANTQAKLVAAEGSRFAASLFLRISMSLVHC